MNKSLGFSSADLADLPKRRDAAWGEHEMHLPSGQVIKYHRRPLPNGGWVSTHEDVTEARRSNQQIAYLAAHDVLTGLSNRATFAAHLEAKGTQRNAFCRPHDRSRPL